MKQLKKSFDQKIDEVEMYYEGQKDRRRNKFERKEAYRKERTERHNKKVRFNQYNDED